MLDILHTICPPKSPDASRLEFRPCRSLGIHSTENGRDLALCWLLRATHAVVIVMVVI